MPRPDPKHWNRVKAIWLDVRERPAPERLAALDEACGDDRALRAEVLEMLEVDGDLDPGFMTGTHAPRGAPSVDGFELGELLGEGGMGIVYRATQLVPRRPVALKFMRHAGLSPEATRRFMLETEVLARLQHEGIARIYGVGWVEGDVTSQPWFAMELVDGVPVTEYVAREGLALPARLTLIADIADAVHHAHEKGVVHRDLKPSNVLVEPGGRPKILDFGVARLVDDDADHVTRAGQVIGTVAYMSPEQIGGMNEEVDTRSDVYALGVLAFEVLTGRLPHDVSGAPLIEAARRIRDDAPRRLGEHDSALRGDPEIIVAKALAPEPGRRYRSAAALADDCRRWLRHEPILAHPASTVYQMRRFARRHRVAVASAAAVVLALVAGLVGTTRAKRQSDAYAAELETKQKQLERQFAESDAARLAEKAAKEELREALADWMTIQELNNDIFRSVSPSSDLGRDVTMRQVLDSFAAGIAERAGGRPRVEAALEVTAASTYGEVGDFEREALHLERAGRILEAHDVDQVVVAEYELARGDVAARNEDYDAAILHLRRARDLFREQGRTHRLVTCMRFLGFAWILTGDVETGVGEVERALEIADRELGETSTTAFDALSYLVSAESRRDYHRSLELVLEMERRLEEADEPTPWVRYLVHMHLSFRYRDLRRFPESEHHGRWALELSQEMFGDGHFQTALAEQSLASALGRAGETGEALDHATRAVEILEEALGRDAHAVARALTSRGGLELDAGQVAAGIATLERALAIKQRLSGTGSYDAAHTESYLLRGRVLRDGAAPHLARFGEVVEILRRSGARQPRAVSRVLEIYGKALFQEMEFARAEEVLREALALNLRLLPPTSPMVGRGRFFIATMVASQGRWQEALEEFVAVHDFFEETEDGVHALDLHMARFSIGRCLVELGDFEAAQGHLLSSLAGLEPILGRKHFKIAEIEQVLATCERMLAETSR